MTKIKKRIVDHLKREGWKVVEERGHGPRTAWVVHGTDGSYPMAGAFDLMESKALEKSLSLLGKIEFEDPSVGAAYLVEFYPEYKLPAGWMNPCIVHWEPVKIPHPVGLMGANYWVGPLSPGQYTEVQRRAEKFLTEGHRGGSWLIRTSKAVLRALGKPRYV